MDSNKTVNVDDLVTRFKREGHFDRLRKLVLETFKEKESEGFAEQLRTIAELELEKDPSLKTKDHFRTAPLIAGAVDRTSLYENTLENIKNNILSQDKLRVNVLETIKQLCDKETEGHRGS
ncbi:Set1C complex subunit Shg1 [Schizosaccharomyces cryophilus OY26]|uniref:Set1C complex subunit Shg1 n=1 Tax=Schizosaccharomyces cryophilus (strain OY26 / ATCC MYA-4695 / CBS 11777 / NBRC 106824 / NRRL Y48691) TaxID=653667 RepID=S9VW64_SCHCR|nr:Set1C complex subunit Shg1 [Schizosaccharomyces cryophilus OY26]EPY51848.1 Set1C complex subunit Shg1 [Schizosaccharomyces cryophilus OY26]